MKLNDILTKDLLETFRGNKMPEQMINSIQAKIIELGNFTPTVGIFGKTGVGKSSLCNALFGKETAKVSDVEACTREPQKIFVKISECGGGINLIDLPGVGESQVRDEEYKKLYEDWLPRLDLIIWVIRADDRTFSTDEYFYENVVKIAILESGTPFIVVINQVDKINPIREWNEKDGCPGVNQQKVVSERENWAASKFKISSEYIIPISAHEKYNLGSLIEGIIDIVPNEKKLGFLSQVKDEIVTQKSEQSAIKGAIEYIKMVYEEVKPYIPEIISLITWIISLTKKSKEPA